MYDMGWSINPALDIGQVEGAFIQGVGYVTQEKLVYQPDGDEKGRLNTVNTWRYKPPATTNIPLQMNVHLFPRDRAAEVPENPNDLMSAKESRRTTSGVGQQRFLCHQVGSTRLALGTWSGWFIPNGSASHSSRSAQSLCG